MYKNVPAIRSYNLIYISIDDKFRTKHGGNKTQEYCFRFYNVVCGKMVLKKKKYDNKFILLYKYRYCKKETA